MTRLKPMAPGSGLDRRVEALADAIVPYTRPEEYAAEIAKLWADAQRKFLLIGRYLVQARAKLEHGDYEAMVRSRLPFSPETARKLRTVAEAIDAGMLPADRVPRDYTAAYYLATLAPEERQQAEAQGLVRPDVPRREVEAFRRKIRASSALPPAQTEPTTPEDELVRLEARLAELEQERVRVLARIAEVRNRNHQ
jgi:hypothetical protein